uniref:Uncharacterized protein n=1 Tax=Oryza sativa subsp. japonica TaxID=39947 RepID=Q75LQ7_ORYSJ|nr:hypothetical protein [Oryza sativa Japonica Group]
MAIVGHDIAVCTYCGTGLAMPLLAARGEVADEVHHAGGSLMFQSSGHGKQKLELSGDVVDGLDEAICPVATSSRTAGSSTTRSTS